MRYSTQDLASGDIGRISRGLGNLPNSTTWAKSPHRDTRETSLFTQSQLLLDNSVYVPDPYTSMRNAQSTFEGMTGAMLGFMDESDLNLVDHDIIDAVAAMGGPKITRGDIKGSSTVGVGASTGEMIGETVGDGVINIGLPGGNIQNLVTRSEWNARQPTSRSSITDIYGVVVHWNGPRMGLVPNDRHPNCVQRVRGIQSFHMGGERGWADIAYSFLVCPHGTVFEGRGWGVQTSANGNGGAGNTNWHAAMYLGGQGDEFTDAGKRALLTVFAESRRLFHPSGNAVRGHYVSGGDGSCPGSNIRAWISSLGA